MSDRKQPSIPSNYRIGLTVLFVAIALLLTFVISLSLGSVRLSLDQFWQALLHRGEPINQTILWQLRLPRVIAAMTVGAALGTSGALLQGMLRNPLAEPFLLGISAGAGLVVIAMVTLGLFQAWIPFAAWIGAILTTAIVYFIARSGNGISVERLILGGVAISSLFGAVQTTLLIIAEEGRIQTALNWIIGSLSGRGWKEVAIASPYILVALLCACLLGRYLNVLNLGDELAVGLGINLARSRLFVGATATLLAASAVSMAGLIGFVGLIVPHGMRLLMGGNDYRWLIPLSAVGGAIVLTLADLLSRLGSIEFPVGVVTSLLGSPLFVWFLYRRSLQ